jgi:hypothetical protein
MSQIDPIEHGERVIRRLKHGVHFFWIVGIIVDVVGAFIPRLLGPIELCGSLFFAVGIGGEILANRRDGDISNLREKRQKEKDEAHAAETKTLRDELKAFAAPRELDTELAQAMRIALPKFAGQKYRVFFLLGVSDGKHYADQINASLKDMCGWIPFTNPESLVDSDFEWPSISFVVWPIPPEEEIPSDIRQTRNASTELAKIILGKEELIYRKSTVYSPQFVNVVVGHKSTAIDEKLKTAEAKIADLLRQQAPRILNRPERDFLRAELSKYGPQKFVVRAQSSDSEALTFASDICDTLVSCGWDGDTRMLANPSFFRGVSMSQCLADFLVAGPSGQSYQNPIGHALKQAFEKTGVKLSEMPVHRRDDVPLGLVSIDVGAKPY